MNRYVSCRSCAIDHVMMSLCANAESPHNKPLVADTVKLKIAECKKVSQQVAYLLVGNIGGLSRLPTTTKLNTHNPEQNCIFSIIQSVNKTQTIVQLSCRLFTFICFGAIRNDMLCHVPGNRNPEVCYCKAERSSRFCRRRSRRLQNSSSSPGSASQANHCQPVHTASFGEASSVSSPATLPAMNMLTQ